MARRKRNPFKRKFNKAMQKKLVMLFMGFVLAFVFLAGRITYINASNGDKYTKVVLDQQQYDSRTIPFKRGDIVDRNGTKMATSERIYNVILDMKAMLSKDDYIEPTIEALKKYFDIKEEDIRKLMKTNPSGRYNVLKKGIGYKEAKKFNIMKNSEKYSNVQGIWLEEDYERKYPYNSLASDTLGFTVDGNIGSNGIEASYNEVLNGTDGREYGYQDTTSTFEQTVKEPVNGKTVVSTIDLQVQSIVEKHILAFNKKHQNEARKGTGSEDTAVIVMNPNNGEILAEASYPNYNLNKPRDLSAYYTKNELAKMTDKEKIETLNALWKNFCVTDTYEPGSTIKPFTVATGLEIGALKGDETYYCGGSLQIDEWEIKCISYDNGGHGQQNLTQVMENSCNVALMQIGLVIGPEEFCKYQSIFGFGQYTGIDLPGEAVGILQSPDGMIKTDLATNSFGQNFNVTMLQLATGFCSLINGGDYYEPHLVKAIQDENGNVIQTIDPVLEKKTISKETSDKLKSYMYSVVQNGSGRYAQVEGYDIGGKTGTAEKLPRGENKNVVSFIGYAPQENPEIMIYVVIDEPNAPDQSATSSLISQLASDIMAEAFPYLNITKAPAE